MKLKFIKFANKTKYYLFKNITKCIYLTIAYKPNFEITIWFEDEKGNCYDHLEFVNLNDLKSYIKRKFTKESYLFLVNIEDGCTFAFIDKKCNLDIKKYKIKRILLSE